MSKAKKSAAPGVAAPAVPRRAEQRPEDKPYVLMGQEQGARPFLQSRDMAARTERDEPRVTAPERGPRAGSVTAMDDIYHMARPEELEQFAGELRKRRGVAPEKAWLRCDNSACGFTGQFKPDIEGAACAKCNFGQRKQGGHLRKLTPEQVAEHLRTQAARDAEERVRAEQAALHRTNTSRGRSGLPPLSLEQFRDEQNRQWRIRQEQDAKLAGIVEQGKRMKAERDKASEPGKAWE